jgi:phosphoglycerate dehydrogenase-like enzyme
MIVSLLKIDSGLLEQVNIKTGECIVSCLDADELEGILPKAEIVIAGGDFDDTMMKKCVGMKWLHIMGAGVDKLPFGDLRDRKVLVSNSRGIHKTQMAEHVIGMMIAFSRKLYMAVKNQARKDWKQGLPVDELLGKTACIIGTGSIGQEFARKLSVFDMKVLGIGKVPHQLEWFDKFYGPEDLQYVLGVSDYVIACVPLTDET